MGLKHAQGERSSSVRPERSEAESKDERNKGPTSVPYNRYNSTAVFHSTCSASSSVMPDSRTTLSRAE